MLDNCGSSDVYQNMVECVYATLFGLHYELLTVNLEEFEYQSRNSCCTCDVITTIFNDKLKMVALRKPRRRDNTNTTFNVLCTCEMRQKRLTKETSIQLGYTRTVWSNTCIYLVHYTGYCNILLMAMPLWWHNIPKHAKIHAIDPVWSTIIFHCNCLWHLTRFVLLLMHTFFVQ